jgi:hypothetical protein
MHPSGRPPDASRGDLSVSVAKAPGKTVSRKAPGKAVSRKAPGKAASREAPSKAGVR